MPLLPHASETESIVGIQFGVFSPDEIMRRSVCEVTNWSTADGKLNSLFDPRMGVLENGKICRSCGQNNHNCPGHFGHFVLARPVYYTQFFKLLMKVLRCVCFKCGKLLIDKERNVHLLKLKGESRWKMVLEAAAGTARCGEDTEDGCGSRQPNKYKEEPVHRIFAEWKDLELPEGVAAPEGATTDDNGSINLSMPLEPEYVHRLLRRITDEDVEFMGFSRHWCRPDWLVCTVLPIPPPQVRPSVTQDNNQRSEDDLTSKLIDIIKANASLKKKIAEDPKKRYIDEWTNLLQYHVATLVDNNIPGVSPAAQRSGRLLKSLQQRLGSKEGRIRSNLQGKRVEFSARSVITPDPNISVKELGVPQKIAMNLTFPEKVTMFNMGKLYKLIQNGPDVYPGAKTIQRNDGRTISLKHVNAKTIELFEGDTVNRHLMDGDVVLFNRQPSLHRMSMMAHIAKILPYNTFRLNVFVTAPYNADFDGDEMNLHAPQSVEAATELREIAAVPLQIVSPRESVPIVSVVQDTLVGANRFTRPNVLFTKKEAMNLLVHAKQWDGKLPAPVAMEPQPMWSGQQILSALLPPVTLQMPNNSWSEKEGKESQNYVKIFNGTIHQGILDKAVFSKALLHIIYNDFGPDITVDFLDALQAMIATFLMNSGFSVGISDLIADETTNQDIGVELAKLMKTIEDQILQLHTGLFENTSGRSNQEEFESKIMNTLNKAVGTAGGIGLKSLADTNRMTNMIKAGSKGSDVNVSQMVATLGQQAIEGKRVPNGFQHRTLPHFKRFDDSAQARGFIPSSYIKGLQPDEFFFHAMSGREGLIDTAVKTADTGYMQRQIRVALEDLIVQHDGSVRDATGNIVQIAYGEDGMNATKLESQALPLATLSETDIRTKFAADGAANAEQYIQDILEDRRVIVEKVFLSKPQKNVRYPVHLDRVIHALKLLFNLKENEGTVSAQQVLDAQTTILNRTHSRNRLWGALVRYYLAPISLNKLGFTPVALDALVEQIVLKHWKSWVEPGQPIGVIAAQSIGEPATQMTLNTFHLAGVAAKSNMTRGVPRLKELLKATKNPKAIELTIPLRRDLRSHKEEARRVSQELEFTLLQDLVTVARIYYDPRDAQTLIAEDADWLAYMAAYELASKVAEPATQATDPLSTGTAAAAAPQAETPKSPWILRFELDRERMFSKNITMDDIAFILKNKFSTELETQYSDYNSSRLVFRIRLSGQADPIDDLTTLKMLQHKVLSATAVRGIPGLRTVNYQKISDIVELKDGKYETVDQYVLISDGSNFADVITHPDVDASRVVSSNVHDMFENLGIEATRATLFKEITTLFAESGSSVNYRHVCALIDKMCHKGRTMSIDRYGINKNDIGPLAKMSFEQTEDIALRAAIFGERDPVLGVSAKVMLGAPIRAGTSFSELIFDEMSAIKLSETTPEQLRRGPMGPQMYTDLELDEALFGDVDRSVCATTMNELQLNVAIPAARLQTVEEEIADVDISIIE